MSTSPDHLDDNMTLSLLADDPVNHWIMPLNLAQTQPLLAFGTDDLASFPFVPPNIDLESSAPASAPLGFGTGELDLYPFDPRSIGMEELYGAAFQDSEEAFGLLLHDAMVSNTMPYATGDADAYYAQAADYDGKLLRDASTSTPVAWDGLSTGTADSHSAGWNCDDVSAAGLSTGSGSLSSATDVEEWLVPLEASVAPRHPNRKQSPEAPPVAGPSRLSPPSPPSPHIDSGDCLLEGSARTACASFYGSFAISMGSGSQSDGLMGRTSTSVDPLDYEIGYGLSARDSLTHPGEYHGGAYASGAQLLDQFGLYAQEDNTLIAPEQSQGSLPEIAQPSTSRAPAAGQPPKTKAKARKPTKTQLRKAEKAQARPGKKVPAALLRPNPFPRVLFKDTERGQQCAARHLTKDSPGPFTCFVCEEHCEPTGSNGEYEVFRTWQKFQSHVSRCGPLESMKPRCPFCDHPEPAYGRPHQMERHLVGYQGNAACRELANLVASGTRTNRALADWLEAHEKPIIPKFLGMRLARIFHCAKYEDLEMNEEPDLTPQHKDED